MKVVICTKYGPPEVLKIKEVPTPEPRNNELLIKIIATTVNSGDVRVRALAVKGIMKIIMRLVLGFTKPRKPVLGTVFSGTVIGKGSKVSMFNLGDKVFGMTGFKFGTYAEYISVNQKANVITMPQNATFNEAASLVFGGQTAIYFLEKAGIAKIKNPKILIYGATGAVGTAAIQIAHYYGADVSAVCSSIGDELVKKLGVKKIVLYDKDDFTNSTDTFDIIFDAVGKISKKQCKKLLKKNGVFKTVGSTEFASETKAQLKFLKKLFEENKYQAVIDQVYPFQKVVEAHRYVDTGRKKGNVVLKI